MDQQERLALAVRAEVAQIRADQARERAEGMNQAIREAGPAAAFEDFVIAKRANEEAVAMLDQAIAATDAVATQWKRDGGAWLLDWVGCSQGVFDRAVAEALAEGVSRS